MKYCWLTALLLSLAFGALAQGNKTLVKTMDPKETSAIQLDFRNLGTEALPWDEGFIRIELEIISNFPEAIMNQLIKAGRYTLSAVIEDDVFVIRAENLDKAVSIGGKDLDDGVQVMIKTPGYYGLTGEGVLAKNFNPEQIKELAGRAKDKADMVSMLDKMSRIKDKVDIQYRLVFKKNEATPSLPKDAQSLTPEASLEEVEILYGEILIDGKPLKKSK